jgi:1,4-dihydroxy-2-naphthoate octaprenyltransferase
MPTDYVTLKKNDSNFEAYLWGTFSMDRTAIPIKSYNLGTVEEAVTFEIIEDANRDLNSTIFHFLKLIKPKNFVFVLLPYLFVISQYFLRLQQESFDSQASISVCLSLVASLFLISGLNARNDVNDHVSGYDRVNATDLNKPITIGLIKAITAQKFSNVLLLFSVVAALPVFWMQPQTLIVAAVAALLIFFGKLLSKNAYKMQHFGEIFLFLLAGPLLTSGFWLAADMPLNETAIGFSIMWGSLILFLVQLNNFANIMTSSQYGIKNTVTRLGFDLAPKFIIFCWSVFYLTWCWVQFAVFFNFTALVTSVLLAVLSCLFFVRLLHIKSPMGSGLMRIRDLGINIFYFISICLVLQISILMAGL